jgi:hypothetical protein
MHNGTGKMGQAKLDIQNGTSMTGQADLEQSARKRQNNTVRTGQSEQDQNRTVRTGQSEQDSQNRTG